MRKACNCRGRRRRRRSISQRMGEKRETQDDEKHEEMILQVNHSLHFGRQMTSFAKQEEMIQKRNV